MTENSKQTDLMLVLVQEMGASLRHRSEQEFLHTAAAVTGFSATVWGVAALAAIDDYPCWRHPALVGGHGRYGL